MKVPNWITGILEDMNKLYTLLFLLLNFVVINTTQAQLALTYGSEVSDTLPTLAQQEELGVEFPQGIMNISNPLMNNSDQQVSVNWQRTQIVAPQGWNNSVCFGEQCWADFISSSEEVGPVVIAPNSSSDFKLQINTNQATLGQSTTEVMFWVGTDTIVTTIIAVVAEVEIPVDTTEMPVDTVVASIEDFIYTEKSFSVYPNPVRNFLNIELNNYEEIQTVEIYNMLGKVIERFILEDANKIQKIDLSSLTEGMFFISLLDNNNNLIETKRFSKVR